MSSNINNNVVGSPAPTTTTTTTTSTTTSATTPVPASPSLQFIVRSKTNSYLENSSTKYGKSESLPSFTGGECKHVEYSPDGSLVAFVNNDQVIICKADTGAVYSTIQRAGIVMISFSPQNSFLLTWERFSEANNNENNLLVWEISNQQILYKTTQKYVNQESWPLIQWTEDEILAGKLVNGEVHFFNGRSIGHLAKKLKLADIASFSFAPGSSPYKISTFVPEKKGTPGSTRIYVYPNVNEIASHVNFYKCSEAKLIWNRKGNAVLIHTFTDTDKTGKSYYGETGLWFLSLDGTSFNLGIKGPIHDVQWSPTLDQFLVVYGNMPSQSTLFNLKGEALVDFGFVPRNTIRFSPNGKLLCLGGFGNLQGDMDFWDLTRYKKISSSQSHCAVYCEWAADSIHFLTAVLSPRIRVDNGVKIIKYDNTVVYQENIPELYQTIWRPQNPLLFPNEKIIYPSLAIQKQSSPQPQKYTPPSQRAAAAAVPVVAAPSQSSPSSLTQPPPPGFKIYLVTNTATNNNNNGKKNNKSTTKDPSTRETRQQQVQQQDNSNEPKRELTPLEKKIKSIERKLKEVEILKSKLNSGEFVPPTGLEKISNEGKFQEDLRKLLNEKSNPKSAATTTTTTTTTTVSSTQLNFFFFF
ncbi:hypothetical protein CYY_008834 [Polysphondylium violaceum]|uniref:Eukaryotic translation initiation factor 2A n=1 Tax=Polysphondylium violaceum TaxID=133409 RepID=A0A8J4PPU3_9MYCE|nr:hypothetical protein CYY_008834 [Polysphondylium violaceum]